MRGSCGFEAPCAAVGNITVRSRRRLLRAATGGSYRGVGQSFSASSDWLTLLSLIITALKP